MKHRRGKIVAEMQALQEPLQQEQTGLIRYHARACVAVMNCGELSL
jgi:hypothetical protein